jgi:iron(III) transport system ATP-binding protein
MISVSELTKSFPGPRGEVRALRRISFEVEKGRLFTLLGPSGCGKTTTLRCIAGLEEPQSGEIHIDERLVFSSSRAVFVAPEKRRIGMVFQSYAIWPHMTVFENVAYPLAGDATKKEMSRRVSDVLERLGLSGLADRLAPNLSGGQQQRVALARALVAQPKVLLLDEPLSNLDAKLREQMRVELKAIHESLDITTVFVTHDQEEALALSDVIALVVDGELVEAGTPTDLYLRPARRITADFLGSSNFVPGEARQTGAGDELVIDSALGPFIARRSAEWRDGSRVALFFRPEYVELITGEKTLADERNCGSAIVERVIFRGDAVDVTLRAGEVVLRARTHPSRIPVAGERVNFRVVPEACILFPAEGEKREQEPPL